MTFTYDVSDFDTPLNRIRLEIGDTDSNRPLLQDEEIERVIEEYSTFNLRVGKCFRLLCSIFASNPKSVKMEGFVETYGDVYAYFKERAVYYENLGGTGIPWAGSIDVDFKQATEEDDSLVTPSFKRGMHDNY